MKKMIKILLIILILLIIFAAMTPFIQEGLQKNDIVLDEYTRIIGNNSNGTVYKIEFNEVYNIPFIEAIFLGKIHYCFICSVMNAAFKAMDSQNQYCSIC